MRRAPTRRVAFDIRSEQLQLATASQDLDCGGSTYCALARQPEIRPELRSVTLVHLEHATPVNRSPANLGELDGGLIKSGHGAYLVGLHELIWKLRLDKTMARFLPADGNLSADFHCALAQEPGMPKLGKPIDVDAMMQAIRAELSASAKPGETPPTPTLRGEAAHARGRSALPPLSTGEIMRRVNVELAQRSRESPTVSATGDRTPLTIPPLHRWRPAQPRLETKSGYTLSDLVPFADRDFVDTAFRALFRRPADAEGSAPYVEALRGGVKNKAEVLAELAASDEGRRLAVPVHGLGAESRMARIRRWPVIGPVLAWLNTFIRLPDLNRRLLVIDAVNAREAHELGRQFNLLAGQIDDGFTRLAARMAEQDRRGELAALERAVQDIEARSRALEQDLHGLRTAAEASRAVELRVAVLERDRVVEGQRVEVAETRVAELRAELHSLHERIATEHAGLATRLDAESDQRATLHDRVTELRHGLETGVSGLRERLEKNLADLAVRIDAGAQQRAEMHGLIDRVREEVDQALSAIARLDALEARAPAIDARLEQIAAIDAAFRHETDGLRNALSGIDTAFRHEADGLRTALSGKADDTRLIALERRIADQNFAAVELQRRLGLLLEEARRRLPAPFDADQLQRFVAEDTHHLDAMYASFEDTFRGNREEIMARARHYLAGIETAKAGTADAPVLDLGCGRGEWLEVLREAGLAARGVDLNSVFLAGCRARGLDVVESDALAYLRELPDASIGAITAMHLVEHLPMDALVGLLDEAARVLRPGGLLALETPNPENLLVGAHYFYLDPTHRNPLPPTLLHWLVEARGFADARIDRLSEHRGAAEIAPVDVAVPGAAQINAFVALLRQAPDYAVIARKPSHRAATAVTGKVSHRRVAASARFGGAK